MLLGGDEGDIQAPVPDQADELVRARLGEVEVDQRITPVHPIEQGHHVDDPETLLRTDPQAAGQLAGGAYHGVARRRCLGEHGAGVGEQGESGRGRFDPTRRPVEQRGAEFVLERADGCRQPRLGYPADGGGAGELLLVGERDEVLHLTEVHLTPSSF